MSRKSVYRSMTIFCILAVMLMISCAYLSSNVATVLSEHADIPNRQVVIIDAGHGGEDGGAVSCTGIPESKTNLEIAIKLQYILQLLGIKTIMIRTEDISVYTSGNTIASRKISDLKQRVNIVNNHPGCTLISIHQNYFSDSKYDGAQVFYNQNTLSRQLALLMQSALVQNLNKSSNRNAKMAEGIYLMENIKEKGILIECGFLSNHEENALLQSKDYQQKISIVIGTSLSLYLNT